MPNPRGAPRKPNAEEIANEFDTWPAVNRMRLLDRLIEIDRLGRRREGRDAERLLFASSPNKNGSGSHDRGMSVEDSTGIAGEERLTA